MDIYVENENHKLKYVRYLLVLVVHWQSNVDFEQLQDLSIKLDDLFLLPKLNKNIIFLYILIYYYK